MRILVTGSRDWEDRERIWHDLDQVLLDNMDVEPEFIVVEGACHTGADRMAYEWVLDCNNDGIAVRPHRNPADWAGPCDPQFCKPGHRRKRGNSDYCPAAGVRRNLEMVETMPDLVLAYIRNGSNGATNCAGLAQKAGIETRVYRIED